MGVNLAKGTKVSLTKAATESGVSGAITSILIGLGWDTNKFDTGGTFDLDASAFLLGADGKVLDSNKDFVFYNNKTTAGVTHQGDNLTGDGDGDDEVILINLADVESTVEKIAFVVTIDSAEVKNQNFGMVSNAYIRVVEQGSGTELIRYDLGEDYSIETAIVIGELYKNGGEWKFNAIGSGMQGGLGAIAEQYGVDVG